MTSRRPRWRALLAALALALVSATATGCMGRYAIIGFGTAIDVLPHGFVSITVGTVPYYYHRGVFYRPYRRGYVVVPAPMGATIARPPRGYAMVYVDGSPFHYYYGTFYAPRGDRYVVVRPPLGAFVRRVPRTAVTRRVDGVEYKEYAGTYYRPAIRDGRRGFEVSEPPPGR